MIEIRPYRDGDEEAMVRLWRDCHLVVPQNDPRKDIRRKLAFQPNLFLVAVEDGQIKGSVMAGYDGHRGFLNYLAVAPENRRKGLGRRLIVEAEQALCALGCPKINLMVRKSNLGVVKFYGELGFSMDEVVCMGKRLEVD